MAFKLKDLDETFVVSRRDALKSDYGGRNRRMDDYLKLYKLDVWEKPADPGERRVASPRAFTAVEAYRTLLFTQRPVIHVEDSHVKAVAQAEAERMEKFLYGAWDEMRFLRVIDEVEFWACSVGRGVFKIVYQPQMPEGELPLVVQSLDPRTYYDAPSMSRPGESVEAVHTFERKRRDIEQDWGRIPDEGRPQEQAALDKWLDEEVEYTDYWREILVEEEREEEPEREKGMMEQVREALRDLLAPEEEAEEKEPEKVYKRKVVNCVMAGTHFVKQPVIVPGYEMLPFFHWDGIHTPLPGKDAGLSVLYPIAGGERPRGSQGLLATENQVLAHKVRMVEMYSNAAAVTNDPSLSHLDMTPGAVTVADKEDYRLDWVMPPTTPPDADRVLAQLDKLSQDATLPDSMHGRYVGEISGVALTLLTNPVLMRIAARQRQREEVLQQANKLILALVEEWAPTDGWVVWGHDSRGREFEIALAPQDINGYRRNRVKLSASLPKDAQGELLLHSNLVANKMESRRTAINRIQEVTGELGRTPGEEINQILVESVLMDEEMVRQMMAMKALEEFDAATAAEVMMAMQEQAQPPGPEPQGPQQPMMGIPPEVVPPERMGGGGTEPPMPPGRPPGV